MSILINKDTRLLVQGITGRDGSFHTQQMLKYGTKVVAGVTPGKGGMEVEDMRKTGIRRRILLAKKGSTLLEVVISLLLVSIGIVGALMYFTSAHASIRLARDMTVATSHTEYILEDMRAKATLADITNTDWADFADNANLDTLTNETVTVTYEDPDADPLNITVTIDWTTNSRNASISFTKELTK